jgi:Uma2 family endonuclease
MSFASAVTPPLLTAEEFARRPDSGHPEELVQGRVVSMPPPKPRHGHLCNRVGRILGAFCDEHRLGWVFNNDTGIITQRDPDTVRGADVAYYSYSRLPEGTLADAYPEVAPDLVFEILSPSERWPKVLITVGEYLDAGTTVVVILEDEHRLAHGFTKDSVGVAVLRADQTLTLPDLLPGFSVPVRTFFE